MIKKTIKVDEKTHKRLSEYLFKMQARNSHRRTMAEAINELLDKAKQ